MNALAEPSVWLASGYLLVIFLAYTGQLRLLLIPLPQAISLPANLGMPLLSAVEPRLNLLIIGALACLAQPTLASAASEPVLRPSALVEPFTHGVVHGMLVLPAATSGVVVILQDTTGSDGRSAAYVDQLVGAGLAVLDIFEHEDNASEVASATAAIADRFGHKPVGVLSFGAGAAIAAGLHPVAAHALLYPGCGERLAAGLANTIGPVLLAHGGLDAANPTSACTETAATLRHSGRAVRHLVYERAGYAWDHLALGLEARFLLPRPDGAGHVQALPWPQLAAMSSSDVANFFSRSLAP